MLNKSKCFKFLLIPFVFISFLSLFGCNRDVDNHADHEQYCCYGYDGKDIYKRCSQCGTVSKVKEFVDNTQDDFFEYYELDDGTFGVGASNVLSDAPKNSYLNITIPSSHLGKKVTEVVERGFSNIHGNQLGFVTIPSSITSVRYAAFNNIRFKVFLLEEGVETIEDLAFALSSYYMVFIPKTIKNMSPLAFYSSQVEKYVVDNDNGTYMSIDDAIYSKNKKEIILHPYIDGRFDDGLDRMIFDDANILEGTELVGQYCFTRVALENIILPSSVKELKEHSFLECFLYGSIVLNEGLLKIGAQAFTDFRLFNREEISIPKTVIEIGEGAFSACALRAMTLPPKLKIIEKDLFRNDGNLDECVIDVGVEAIREHAFLCTSVDHLTFLGTMEQWSHISLDDGWDLISSPESREFKKPDVEEEIRISKIVCSDGSITL